MAYKVLKMETAVGTETALNKLEGEGWRVVGAGPDYLVLSDQRIGTKVAARARRVHDDPVMVSRHGLNMLHRENADLSARVEELEDQLEKQLDPESVKHWDSMRKERDAFRRAAGELFDALLWTGGSKDFAPGDEITGTPPGEARVGWENGPRKALEAYQALIK